MICCYYCRITAKAIFQSSFCSRIVLLKVASKYKYNLQAMHTWSSFFSKGYTWLFWAKGLRSSMGDTVSKAQVNTRPIKWVKTMAGFGSKCFSGTPVNLRALKLTELLGLPFVIDSHASSRGIVASQTVQQFVPNGVVLNFIAAGKLAMKPSLFESLSWHPQLLRKPGVEI